MVIMATMVVMVIYLVYIAILYNLYNSDCRLTAEKLLAGVNSASNIRVGNFE